MKSKPWLPAVIALAVLAVLAAVIFLPRLSPAPPLPSPSAPPPPLSPSPSPPVPPPPTTAWGDLPTVTPPNPGEPTLPPEAQAMQAAPTATPSPIPPPPSPTQTPIPTPTPVPATGFDDVPMVEVPAGEFLMGVTEDTALDFFREWYAKKSETSYAQPPTYADQTPQLTVYLDTFSIDQVEVTNARYRRCVETGFCTAHDYSPIPGYSTDSHYNDYPALVPWTDARVYCQWVGKRLPGEAEWEKAARGTDGRPYPWGWEQRDDWASLSEGPVAVGSHPQDVSPYGAWGLASNVPEWTLDRYRPYPGNLRWQDSYEEFYRVTRGVGWENANHLTTFRWAQLEGRWAGFRCVQGPEPPALAQAVVDVSTYPTPASGPPVDLDRMAYVPAGEFIMGNDDVGDDPIRQDERPAHVVYLDAFYIDRYEVTVVEFAAFLNALGGHKWRCGLDCIYTLDGERPLGVEIQIVNGRYEPGEGYGNTPVTIATWEGAQAYCEWAGKRLPTEAEWEKAARGTDGRLYPWGNEWHPDRPAGASWPLGTPPAPVGTHPGDVSPYGVSDMLGNVDEWVADWYNPEYYQLSPYANPEGPDDGAAHVVRSRFGPAAENGVTDRTTTLGFTGFRCARTP